MNAYRLGKFGMRHITESTRKDKHHYNVDSCHPIMIRLPPWYDLYNCRYTSQKSEQQNPPPAISIEQKPIYEGYGEQTHEFHPRHDHHAEILPLEEADDFAFLGGIVIYPPQQEK